MAAKAMTPAEIAAQLRALSLFRKAVEERGSRIPYDLLAARLDVARDTVEAWFKRGDRRISPERMREIARTLGVDPVSAFIEAGWLDAADIERFAAGLPGAPSGGRPSGLAVSAPQRAAELLLHDPVLRERFDVTLSALVAAGTYRLATDLVAEFRLRSGAAPLSLSEAFERAEGLRGVWLPDDEMAAAEPEYCAIRLELAAAFHWALREYGRYTWQGDPGSTVWQRSTLQWPAHVMVQDVVSGLSRPAAPGTGGLAPIAPRPIVVIGGRYSCGLAAALLAEALGWQFALVSSTTLVHPDGSVGAVHRPWDDGPAYAWSDAYAHLTERHADGDPWRCVLLVRPYSFLTRNETPDLGALEQLRRAEAQVVYARPSTGAIDWFTERQVALAPGQTYRPQAHRWRETTQAALRSIEDVLGYRSARRTGQDLTVAMREPDGPLEVCDPRVPAEVVDAQVRLAWQVIRWLSPRMAYAGPSLLKSLQPGSLLAWQALLEADQTPGPVALTIGS